MLYFPFIRYSAPELRSLEHAYELFHKAYGSRLTIPRRIRFLCELCVNWSLYVTTASQWIECPSSFGAQIPALNLILKIFTLLDYMQ